MSATRRIVRREVDADLLAEGDWPAHWPLLLRRVHAARGSRGLRQAMPGLAELPPPDGLLGLPEAVALLRQAIAGDLHIVVSADFDCDGATACAVAVRGLRMLGARRVSYAVPDRMRHGYGLTPGFVDELAALRPDVLLTVDHGIACHAGIAAARARGWRVVVTDHHLPGDTLPDADAIVNPQRPGDAFVSKALAGVGVLFYLLLALRAAARAGGEAEGEADLGALLDLVAVGTVADMVRLDVANRALIGAGLRRLRKGWGCAGLRALIDVAQRDVERLTTADIGYAIAPRINAAGRLEDMRLGIELLLGDDLAVCRAQAEVLDAINRERRRMQRGMVDEAIALPELQSDALVPCVAEESWHPGVVGLVASKLKERLHRPVFAFAAASASEWRGSARSIPGFHLRDAIALVDARHPGLITRFGGHAMAAGLTLPRASLDGFAAAIDTVARECRETLAQQEDIASDGELPLAALDIAHARAFRDGGAWGQGYPEPLFDGVFAVADWRIVGERHLKLTLEREGRRFGAMHFDGWEGENPAPLSHLAYRLTPDDWRGGEAIQLIVVHRQAA
ncbi:single-stranded-DNA-specific exonuclease RecJ [Solilutibacter pythonis]|uniref:single-stranded-DNA-specific exonuclease RecJ n=1 Tax=Solilutibacter pythonis TaxID=2483112 RepID=UPI0026807DAF